jgi:multiple sugar transport system permease protein
MNRELDEHPELVIRGNMLPGLGRIKLGFLRRIGFSYILSVAVLTLLAILFLFPLYWMFSGSFKAQSVTISVPPEVFPSNPTLENWKNLFGADLPILRWLTNSLIVAGGTTLLTLFISSLTGYSFGKKKFIGSRVLFLLMLATMMLPSQVILIPLFIGVRVLGLYNTYAGMILPMAAFPFGVFLMRQFMATIPNEIMDAAKIDGVSEWGMYWRIILPLSGAGLAALAIFTFSNAWNNFMWQLLISGGSAMNTLPVGVSGMARTAIGDRAIIDIGLLMAGGTFGALPMILFFLAFQRYFVKGITVGAVKG